MIITAARGKKRRPGLSNFLLWKMPVKDGHVVDVKHQSFEYDVGLDCDVQSSKEEAIGFCVI